MTKPFWFCGCGYVAKPEDEDDMKCDHCGSPEPDRELLGKLETLHAQIEYSWNEVKSVKTGYHTHEIHEPLTTLIELVLEKIRAEGSHIGKNRLFHYCERCQERTNQCKCEEGPL